MVDVDERHVVVQVVQRAGPPSVVSQRNCQHFGFATADGGPDGKAFLRFVRRHRIPAAEDGHLRLVRATTLLAAIDAAARVPVQEPTRRDGVADDDALLAQAGVRRGR